MHFEFSGKKIRLLATAVTAFIFIFVAAHWKLYLGEDIEFGKIMFVLSFVGGAAAWPLIAVRARVDDKYKMFANTVLFFIMPIFTMQMVECLNDKFIWNFSVKTAIANYLVYLVFYLIVWFISGRYHLAGLIVNISLYVWALLNYFVEQFRGTPFLPADIISAKTGLSVADSYEFGLSWEIILASIIFFLIYLTNKRIKNEKPKKLKYKITWKCACAAYLGVVLISFFFTDFSANTGYKPDFWNQARGYHKTGSFFNFCLNTKYLKVRKPSGYDADEVEDFVYDTLKDYGVDPEGDASLNILTGEDDYVATATEGDYPNVIYIMNESWADLGNMGDLETNEDYMPFIHSLTENTIKGYLSMPVFGAGTSNSEFEALTGDTIAFLPSGCNVYQLYIKKETPSLVSSLISLGYSHVALHPYYGDGWNRETVYPLLGFSDFLSIEDIIDQDILDEYEDTSDVNAYEDNLIARYDDGDQMLLRRFIRDSYDFGMIEDMYESRDTNEPFFIFNVTMQNHGGYAVSYRNFDQQIYITNMEGDYPKANRYLSLVKETDSAFESLVEYFSNVAEPTVICMFGDHLPSIETEFYEELLGSSLDNLTTEQEQLRYETPFVIWANYDIDETVVDHISSNYLHVLLEQVAGLPLTLYDKYLAAVYQTVPVIDTVGYVDADGTYYSANDEVPFATLLNEYNCVEYNMLLDKKNRVDGLFYLN